MAGLILNATIRYPRSMREEIRGFFNYKRQVNVLQTMMQTKRGVLLPSQWKIGQSWWKPLSKPYLEWKIDHGFFRTIWTKTGNVFNAVTGQSVSDAGAAGAGGGKKYLKVSKKGKGTVLSLLLPKTLDYWAYVEEGRPWISWRGDDDRMLQKVVDDWMDENAKALVDRLQGASMITLKLKSGK